MKKITITLFVCRSNSGIALAKDIEENIETIVGSSFKITSFKIIENGTQYDMLKAIMQNDLVIFDGSLEYDINGNWCSQYEASTANIISNDNIAVVSRTILPINYTPFLTNVPSFGSQGVEKGYNFSNNSIIQWLQKTIVTMNENGRLPRSSSHMLNLPPFEDINEENYAPLIAKMNEITEENVDYIHNSSKHKNSAFISYRSYYCKNTSNGWDVEKLADYIKDYHKETDGTIWDVIYYPSGVLSSELMPEFRRWGFISYVDRKLRETDEVWIFNTSNSNGEVGYFDSWWTQGEIISLMYIKKHNPDKLPTIFIFDTTLGCAQQMPDSFIPDVPDEVDKELVRYFCNSDFMSGGVESLAPMRLFRQLSDEELEEIVLPHMNMLMQTMMTGFSDKHSLDGNTTLPQLKSSLSSHTYDLSFVENRLIVCPDCFNKGTTINDFQQVSFIRSYMNVNNELTPSQVKGVNRIIPEDMERIIERKEWECPSCHTKYCIQENTDTLLSMWWPIRAGRYTGPDNCIIENIPVYEIKKLNS